MSTKKDLVEAHAFSRRRLVTAFVSGAPGGREVEPSRPGRTIVGGVALGVLVLAGGAIAGVFSSRPPDGWLEPGIVIEEETGNTYVITEESDDPVLRPVIGNINARLIFGPDQEPSSVSAEDIAGQTIGDDIGILGAPARLPVTDELVNEGWVACGADGAGLRVDVSASPRAQAAPGTAHVVRLGSGDEAKFWVVATGGVEDDQAFRFRLPSQEGNRDEMLDNLDLPLSVEATRVSEAWLNLWPNAEQLDPRSFDIGDEGPVPDSVDWFEGLEEPAQAGDVVQIRDSRYLVTADAPALLTDFDYAVYLALGGDPEPEPVDDLRVQQQFATPERWPDLPPEPVEDGSLCGMLVPRDVDGPTVVMADAPDEDLALEAESLGRNEVEASVEPGRGSFVVGGGFEQDEAPSPVVVDSKGVLYLVEGYDAIVNLGYGEVDAPVVPDAWLDPFDCGVVLSRNAALGEPSTDSQQSCDE